MTTQSGNPDTVGALVARIGDSYAALEELIKGLSPEQLAAPGGPDHWSVKDHLAHIAVWEKSLLGLLERRPRWEAMGVSRADYEAHDTDALNAVIEAQHRDRPAADVLADFRATHERVLAALQRMTDADLQQPYARFQPDEQPPNTNAVIGWVHGNTWEHMDEHRGWITVLLAEARGARRDA